MKNKIKKILFEINISHSHLERERNRETGIAKKLYTNKCVNIYYFDLKSKHCSSYLKIYYYYYYY